MFYLDGVSLQLMKYLIDNEMKHFTHDNIPEKTIWLASAVAPFFITGNTKDAGPSPILFSSQSTGKKGSLSPLYHV